jgi:two-component system, NtrC family, response regulator HydG
MYSWPGNVRELQHAVERAVILSDKQVLQPGDFLLSRPEPAKKDGLVFEDYNMDLVERTIIRKAIEKHGGNISRAAKELGYTRSALYRRLGKYGL